MYTHNVQQNQHGLTLVEVMVALLVLSVGLLGLAGLQINGIRGAAASNYRVQAVMLANELADRMHTNVPAADANSFAAVNILTNACPAIATDCLTADCNSTDLATFDLNDICLNTASTLPQPATITVTCNDIDTTDGDACTNGSTHTIQISWNEVIDSSINNGQRTENVSFVITP